MDIGLKSVNIQLMRLPNVLLLLHLGTRSRLYINLIQTEGEFEVLLLLTCCLTKY